MTASLRRVLSLFLVFAATFTFLFLGMDRGFDFYDEGLNLVDAMRVAAGQVPHRDFYINYGPAQAYTLAFLFHLFGSSVFVERIYDLALRSAIVTATWGVTAAWCKQWIAVSTTLVCALWMFSTGLPTIGYPVIPVLLLSMISSALLLPMFSHETSRWRATVSGCLSGLAALFRYDIGVALFFIQALSIGSAGYLRRTDPRRLASRLSFYVLGVAVMFLPPALLYLSAAPIQPFLHDIVLYPAKYYARARRVPLPGLHWRSLENIAVYLPIVVSFLCLYIYSTARSSNRRPAAPLTNDAWIEKRMGFFTLFGTLATVFFLKGLVRISVAQMLLSIIFTVITLAVLYGYTQAKHPLLHRVVQVTMALSIFAATWSTLKEMRVLLLSRSSVLEEMIGPLEPTSVRPETDCHDLPERLNTGLCFIVAPSYIRTIRYITEHTKPSERIFIGLTRHDRLVMNDLLTYYASDRLPATHWAQFDPDLQMRADIQSEMVRELDNPKVRLVILESQFDSQVQPFNDSSKSSGVTLLDEYVRTHYCLVETDGALSIWLRNWAENPKPALH